MRVRLSAVVMGTISAVMGCKYVSGVLVALVKEDIPPNKVLPAERRIKSLLFKLMQIGLEAV